MAHHIHTRRAPGTWVIRAGGAVIGETKNAIELNEGGHDPVIYFPPADIAMAFLEPSTRTSQHPQKGEARYYAIAVKSGLIENAAWSYEAPPADIAEIAGHLAFHSDRVTVEQL